MTAVLCRHFGLKHIEIAEDIVSETFLKASETWPLQGTPENPTAWLYTVAKNKTKDYLKHTRVFETQVSPALLRGADQLSARGAIRQRVEEARDNSVNLIGLHVES